MMLGSMLVLLPGAGDAGASDEPKTLPQDGLFSSIKQSLREGDQEIVRGHFDLGASPNVHRYYCLMDPKTHRREPNGVLGDPILRPDGMTGIKSSAVSLYRCEKAEQQGMLVTAGYVTPARAGASSSAASAAGQMTAPPAATATPSAAAVAAAMPVAPRAQTSALPAASLPDRFPSGMVDVSGIKLGMSPDEVIAVLKSKGLHEPEEWHETLSRGGAGGRPKPIENGRFVSFIAASGAAGASPHEPADGESFEVMFTPVPGHERAMGIVHSVGYSPSRAIHETALESGLVEKYGGDAASVLPSSPTWLFQAGDTVSLGDTCGRRDILGGLAALHVSSPRENLSLTKSADELRFEVQHCGIAIVTEDHRTADDGALRADRMVTRYTVTAYSPTLAVEGASKAQELIDAAGTRNPAPTVSPKDSHAPDL